MKNEQWRSIYEIGPNCRQRFLDIPRVPELKKLDIQLAGVSELSGHYRVGRVKPDSHTLIYTVEGEGLLHVHDETIRVEKSSLITLPAGEPFLIETHKTIWTTAWLNLNDTPRWRALCINRHNPEFCSRTIPIYYLLCLIYHELDSKIRAGSLAQLEFYLADTLSSPKVHIPEIHRIDALFRDVEKQLHLSWSIEKMCSLVHYSESHLHRLCQQRYRRSPKQQVVHLRMERAKYLLGHTNWTVAQVAGHVGYRDVFSFTKRFKKSVGSSPAAFRKSLFN